MKIGIMGAGFVGGSFGKALTKAGHEVMFSSRNPGGEKVQTLLKECGSKASAGTPAQTLAYSEVIAVAMHWRDIPDLVKNAGDWSGKIVIDMTNRFDNPKSGALEMAELTGARVVKAFNTIGAEHYQDPLFDGQAATMLIAGDDGEGKIAVTQLASDIGFEVIDAGNLAAASKVEALASVWVHLAYNTPIGRDMAFKIIKK